MDNNNNNNNASSKINKNHLQAAMNNISKNINSIGRNLSGRDKIDEINKLKEENRELNRFLFKLYQENKYDRKELKKLIYKDLNKKFM
ncbi:hypothetical protein [Staphylococcus phage LY01]|nr:hypothetical protein [Staphylococcus phage LY01]